MERGWEGVCSPSPHMALTRLSILDPLGDQTRTQKKRLGLHGDAILADTCTTPLIKFPKTKQSLSLVVFQHFLLDLHPSPTRRPATILLVQPRAAFPCFPPTSQVWGHDDKHRRHGGDKGVKAAGSPQAKLIREKP